MNYISKSSASVDRYLNGFILVSLVRYSQVFVAVFLYSVCGSIFDVGFYNSSELICKRTLCSINLGALRVVTWIDMSTSMVLKCLSP